MLSTDLNKTIVICFTLHSLSTTAGIYLRKYTSNYGFKIIAEMSSVSNCLPMKVNYH